MKKVIITLLCLAILSGGGYAGYRQYDKKKNAKKIVDVVPISMLRETYWAEEQTLDATVTSGSSQNVYLDSDKLVKELHVGVGDRVSKGDLLLEYDITLLDLELDQQKNKISVIEQQIKEAERDLNKYENLIPSEYAPSDNGGEDYEPEDEDPEEEPFEEEPEDQPPEEEEAPPVQLIERVTGTSQAFEPPVKNLYQFRCTHNAVVTKPFMQMLKFSQKRARLFIYGENQKIMYIWEIDGSKLDEKLIEEWCVSDGVEMDEMSISFDSTATAHGKFKIYIEPAEAPDDTAGDEDLPDDDTSDDDLPADDGDDFPDDDIPDDGSEDYPDDDYDDSDSGSENYMYSKAELERMIREKKQEIKELKLDKKNAELEYKESQNRKLEGSVLAEIDGTVVKIGSDAVFTDMPTDFGDEDGYYEEDWGGYDEGYSDFDDSGSSDAYIVIQGDDGICIDINVGELNLDKFSEGTEISGMSWETGESFTATVIGVKEEPASYSSYMWNDNPNSSTYLVTASINGNTSLSIGNWVSVNMPADNKSSGGLYLPLQYLRKEGADYYVMKADKNGRLKKQYIKSGKIIWGCYLEVKGGVKLDDMICFPYGKDAKEGIKTRKSDEVLY